MSRPPIEKQKYDDAIKQLEREGKRPEEITATRIYKIAGGTYSKCIEIVDEYLAKNQNPTDKVEPMPPWFRDFVAEVTQAAQSTWVEVSSKMRSSFDEIVATYNEKRAILKAQRDDDLMQISTLETLIEKQDDELRLEKKENERLGQANAKLEGELIAKTREMKDLTGRYLHVEEEKTNLRAEHKVALNTIERLEKSGFSQDEKINEMQERIERFRQINKDLDHRVVIAETRTLDLEARLEDIKNQHSKIQIEKDTVLQELKALHLEKTNNERDVQERIRSFEKMIAQTKQDIAVEIQKSEGLSNQLTNLKEQITDLKTREAEQRKKV